LDKEVVALNKPALAALLKKSLEDRTQAAASKPPVPNAQPNKPTHKLRAVEGHVNDGYESEEYECIKENVSVLSSTQVLI
jgi:hypothetical protein